MAGEPLAQRAVKRPRAWLGPHRQEQRQVVGEEERDPAVPVAERPEAHPDHLPRRAESVEVLGPVAGDPRRQHVPLEDRRRHRRSLQLLDHVEERVRTAAGEGRRRPAGRSEALPVHEQPREGVRLRGLDLPAQGRERAPPQRRQDLGRAPLAARTTWAELALEQAAGAEKRDEGREDRRLPAAEAPRRLAGAERAVRARVARDELAKGLRHGLEERGGQPGRRRDAERVAQAARVLGGGIAFLAAEADADRATLAEERLEPLAGAALAGTVGPRVDARGDLVGREVAQPQQQVVQAVGARRPVLALERLQLQLEPREDAAVEQLPQLGLPQQLAQLGLVDGEGLGAALGERRVAVVEVVRDVAEEESGREGRRRGRVDGDEADLALAHAARELDEAG